MVPRHCSAAARHEPANCQGAAGCTRSPLSYWSKESAHRNDASHAHRLDARTTGRLGSAERMSKLGEPVVPASLIGGGEMGVCTAWAWDQKAVRCADAQRLHTKR